MTQDDIISMAREAGFSKGYGFDFAISLERFAALVAAHEREKQAEQEPVVFYRCNGCGHAYESFAPSSCDCMEGQDFSRIEYYAAPVRTKDLTDDEIEEVIRELANNWSRIPLMEYARAVIAAYKEKNRG